MAYSNPTPYPSVSDIISPYIDKKWFTDECRNRGEIVHGACEAHIRGLYHLPLTQVYQKYLDSFKRWADLMIDEIIITEERLIDKKLAYCGKFDAILRLKGTKKPVLVDWKTSQSVQMWWKIQLIAYKKLAEVNDFEVSKCFSVRIKPNGSGCLVDEYRNNDADWNIFVGLLNSYKCFNLKRGEAREE